MLYPIHLPNLALAANTANTTHIHTPLTLALRNTPSPVPALQLADSNNAELKFLSFGVGGALVSLIHIYATKVAHHHLTKVEDQSRMQVG